MHIRWLFALKEEIKPNKERRPNMTEFNHYCTQEQTTLAYRLNAPLDPFNPDNSNGIILGGSTYAIPTVYEMCGWLYKQGILITLRPSRLNNFVVRIYTHEDGYWRIIKAIVQNDRDLILYSAIDFALERLSRPF